MITEEYPSIPVVTATNNNFCIMAAAFLRSIEINCRNPGKYLVYILADRVSKQNKRRLLRFTSLRVRFIDIDEKLISRFKLPEKVDYLPKTAYFRLMIPELFSSLEKVIYLDVDTLVLRDLEDLWNIDMEGKLSLACQCFYAPEHRGLENFRTMGIDVSAPYFNSGMLVIDLRKWREFGVREKVNTVLNTKLNQPNAMDEEGLNVVLHGHWKPIDQRWNYPPHIADREDMPFVLHYIGYKPMYYDYKTGHQELFFQHLKGTAWENEGKYGFFKKAYIKGPSILKMRLKELLTRRKMASAA